MKTFNIATFNVNSIRSRLHIVLPWLGTHQPDVLCMQETKVEDAKFPLSDFINSGYHVTFRGGKRYNGVAIVTREKPSQILHGLDDDGPPDEDRLIALKVGEIHILNTYIPQGRDRNSEQFLYKLRWFERLKTFIQTHWVPQDPLIWCGDLNVAPEAIDVYDPKRLLGHVCFNPDVWAAYANVRAWGFTDVFRRHHPDEPGQYTFFDYRVPQTLERGLGWRIDHILATGTLADNSRSCFIDLEPRRAEKPSDHTVLIAEFL
ncbi:MAG: exodeoxyribonuclease III [Deltaproteobacteria bacterium]|nr:exodeoxyribonuclease III [Deltaproteobacteria bacterium]